MNAIADPMLLLDAAPETAGAVRALEPAARISAARWETGFETAIDDEDEDDGPCLASFDGEAVLDWTVRAICACKLQALTALQD